MKTEKRKLLLEQAQARLDNVIRTHQPPFIWVAYSGGSDSACVIELMKNIIVNVPWGVMTIDTGLSSIGHIDRIVGDMSRANLPLEIFYGNGLTWYIENVMQYGYAYTPNQHVIYYRELKEVAIDDSVKSKKTKYHQKIVSITGVRRAESVKRSKTPIVNYSRSARVTLNMIADYSEDDKAVILDNVDWYKGKLTQDCMCNWHRNYDEKSDMNSDMSEAVSMLNAEMRSCGLWLYGEKPSREQLSIFSNVRSDIADMPIDSFCSNCIRGKRSNR
jgi:predicted phosphoadenosine phosphosulfate sulfurtransferase